MFTTISFWVPGMHLGSHLTGTVAIAYGYLGFFIYVPRKNSLHLCCSQCRDHWDRTLTQAVETLLKSGCRRWKDDSLQTLVVEPFPTSNEKRQHAKYSFFLLFIPCDGEIVALVLIFQISQILLEEGSALCQANPCLDCSVLKHALQ